MGIRVSGTAVVLLCAAVGALTGPCSENAQASAIFGAPPPRCLVSPRIDRERQPASRVECPADPKAWLSERLPKAEPGSQETPNVLAALKTHARELAEEYRDCDVPAGSPGYDQSPIGIRLRRAQLKLLFGRELFLLQRTVGHSTLFQEGFTRFKERWSRFPWEDPAVLRLDQQATGDSDRCWLMARISPEDCPELRGTGVRSLIDTIEENNRIAHVKSFRQTGIPPHLTHDLLKTALVFEIVRPLRAGQESIEWVLRNVNRAAIARVDSGRLQNMFYEYFPELMVDEELRALSIEVLGRMRPLSEFRRRFDLLNQADEPEFEDRALIIQYMRYRNSKDKATLEPLSGAALLSEMRNEWSVYRRLFFTIHKGLSKDRSQTGQEEKGIDVCDSNDKDCLKARNQEQLRFIYFLIWQALKENPPPTRDLQRLEARFGTARDAWLSENSALIKRARDEPKWLRTRDNLAMATFLAALTDGDAEAAASMLRLLGFNYVDTVDTGISRLQTQTVGGVAVAGVAVVAIVLALPSGGSSIVLLGVAGSSVASGLFWASAAGGVGLAAKQYFDAREDYEQGLVLFRTNHVNGTELRGLQRKKSDAGMALAMTAPSVMVLAAANRLATLAKEEQTLVALAKSKSAQGGWLSGQEAGLIAELRDQQLALRALIKLTTYGAAGSALADGDWKNAAMQLALGKLLAPGGNGFPGVQSVIRVFNPGVAAEADTLLDQFIFLKLGH